MYKVLSYQVADSIDLKGLKSAYKEALLYGDTDELFYQVGEKRFLSVFRFGVLSFLNYSADDCDAFLRYIVPFCKNPFAQPLNDEFFVETDATQNRILHNKIEIVTAEPRVLRMIMLTLSQSVALDYYSERASRLLDETNYHTQRLEQKGRLTISGNKLKKYIGKTLLLKNRISQHLYIFDSPPETWEDERLDRLHTELKRNFDLTERFRGVADSLEIVGENLELFRDLLQYRTSVVLEWIIIALIAVEVINFLVEKF